MRPHTWSENGCYELSKELLKKSLPRRWRHVQGVAKRAGSIGGLFKDSDAELLVCAALLHDIGYSPALAQTGFHALDGARFLTEAGAPLRLCALVAHHSCAYQEAELRGLSMELAGWEDEQTLLRDALWWADMTTTPDGQATTVNERIDEIEKRYGPEDLVTFFIRQAKNTLTGTVERIEEHLRMAEIDYTAK